MNAHVFGSVALQAYLPDGDIDFSLFQEHGPSVREAWAARLHASLQREQRKPSSSAFLVTDPQVINADVSDDFAGVNLTCPARPQRCMACA